MVVIFAILVCEMFWYGTSVFVVVGIFIISAPVAPVVAAESAIERTEVIGAVVLPPLTEAASTTSPSPTVLISCELLEEMRQVIDRIKRINRPGELTQKVKTLEYAMRR